MDTPRWRYVGRAAPINCLLFLGTLLARCDALKGVWYSGIVPWSKSKIKVWYIVITLQLLIDDSPVSLVDLQLPCWNLAILDGLLLKVISGQMWRVQKEKIKTGDLAMLNLYTGSVGDTASRRGHVNHETVKQILHERSCLSELTWPFTR